MTPEPRSRSGEADECWPADALQRLATRGGWKWAIPTRLGGAELSPAELMCAYEDIARESPAAALILSQRDGAADLILRGENPALAEDLLPQYAAGARLVSLGISQLTTSVDAQRPKLRAAPRGDGLTLDGFMPWVTAAQRCDEIVAGAVLPDGRQCLVALDCHAPGVVVEPPLAFLGISGALTSRVICQDVEVSKERVVRGPAAAVLRGRGEGRTHTVTAIALGHCGAICEALDEMGANSGRELLDCLNAVRAEYAGFRADFHADLRGQSLEKPDASKGIWRVRVNALVNRLAVALVIAAKGAGYLRGSRAERLLREAMFFNVWSAPAAVQAGTLRRLLGLEDQVFADSE